MKFVFHILTASIIIFSAVIAQGQNETYLQAFSSPVLINPSFAGLNNHKSFNSGNQYYFLSKERAYNLFYASYDAPFEKIKGGFAISMQHGVIGQNNISISELNFAYAGLEQKFTGGRIRFSASTGMALATKHWFTYLLDQMFVAKGDRSSLPGKKFTRYYLLKPGLGFLCEFNSLVFGLAGNTPLHFNLSDDDSDGYQKPEDVPLSLSFYLSKKLKGNRRGLKSSPYQSVPELIVFYNREFILSRASIKIEQIDKTFGVFLQSDFTNHIHCLGGTIGYTTRHLKINLNTGIGVPGVSDLTGISCEISLNMNIPPVHYSKIKPWAPKK